MKNYNNVFKEFCEKYGVGWNSMRASCDYKKIWGDYKVFIEHENFAMEHLKRCKVITAITSNLRFKIYMYNIYVMIF